MTFKQHMRRLLADLWIENAGWWEASCGEAWCEMERDDKYGDWVRYENVLAVAAQIVFETIGATQTGAVAAAMRGEFERRFIMSAKDGRNLSTSSPTWENQIILRIK